MKYEYVPLKKPRPTKAAFRPASGFDDGTWHCDGFVAVRAPLPAGVNLSTSRFAGRDPSLLPNMDAVVLEKIREAGRAGTLAPVSVVGEVEPTEIMLKAMGREKWMFLVLRVKDSDWLRVVNKAKFDYVYAHFGGGPLSHLRIYADRVNVTSPIVFGVERKIVGVVMPFQYAKPGEFAYRLKGF